jgi:Uma2 family endonuclease
MRRFTVAEYHEMIQRGILGEEDHAELLEGYVVTKMPHNPPHDSTVTRIQRRLMRLLSDDWLVRIQCAITTRDSEPEPDIVVARGTDASFETRHPGPADVFLLIEVADSTLLNDRIEKARLYARAKIQIYWIVNIPEMHIEVYTDPRGGRSPAYRRRQDYGIDESVPLVLGTQVIAHLPVRQLMPEQEPES